MSHTATPRGEFLQSPLWREVQAAAGRRVFWIGDCLLIKHSLPFGKCWLYSPRPEIRNEEQFKAMLSSADAIAKRERAIFWKVDGVKELKITNYELRITNQNIKIRNSSPLQYPETFILDLSKTEEELLKNMKPKTRYNIGLAKKRGVNLRWSKNLDDAAVFYRLLTKTAERQKIGIHSEEHYRNIIKILGKENAAAIIFAYHNNQPIAANLITFFGDTAVYLHGGTDERYRNLMAPYLLQWETMQEAKRRGLRWYDLGGCAVRRGKVKEWAGITRFKQGFGGELAAMGETYDVVFARGWYWLYTTGQKIKRVSSALPYRP